MNPHRVSERSDLRAALGSDECLAGYIAGLKRRRSLSGIVRHCAVDHTLAEEARRIVDEAMRGASLTEALYTSREDDPTT